MVACLFMISWLQVCGNTGENSTTTSRTSFSKPTSTIHSHASRLFLNGSIQFLEPIVLPWKHILPNRELEIEIRHVRVLQFSADSQLFTVSSEPPNTNECIFHGWGTKNGKYINRINVTIPVIVTPYDWNSFKATPVLIYIADSSQGNIDTSQVWITAFTPLMPTKAILVIASQRALRLYGFISQVPSWKSVEMDIQLLDVLPLGNSDEQCFFIGREKRKGGTVKALYVERNRLKNKISKIDFQYTIDLECDDWIPGRDAAATHDDGHLFVIARVEKQGFLRRFIRPQAPKMARH